MKKPIISFSIRVPEDTHSRLRIIAAFRNASINTVINEALEASIAQWEQKYGPLPLPPEGLQ
ncbi:MAG: toxin-antitoxin system HicB family antitoxin [Synergistaceae bacterium]|nr:toxin-antitoxin system HicB family antitoxin [Synergistaceae bacterium]